MDPNDGLYEHILSMQEFGALLFKACEDYDSNHMLTTDNYDAVIAAYALVLGKLKQ